MNNSAVVRTAFSAALDELVAAGARVRAMPNSWDIAGGDSAGWGRGLAGPVWVEALGGVVFSDTAHHRRILWVPGNAPELCGKTAGAIVGATLDAGGRFVGCDWAGRRIIAERNGAPPSVMADNFAGKAFNRPGDICRGGEDDFYFTDQKVLFPPNEAGVDAIARSGVYRLKASGTSGAAGVEDTGIVVPFPGGLCFDGARRRLLVTEPRTQRIHAYPVRADGSVDHASGTVVATLEGPGKGAPHGLAIDAQGHIFVGGPGGIWVLQPDGTPIGIVHLTASRVTGLAIGGGTLFVTTPVGVGAIDLAPGVRPAAAGMAAAPAVLRQPLGLDQRIERHDPALDRIIAPDAVIRNHGMGGFFEDLGGGENEVYSRSLEGLFWSSAQQCLMFSDIGNNRRLRLTPETGDISVAVQPTGHTNGATLDHDGNVLSCEHSERRISRLLPNGQRVTVVDRTSDGRRLNHPNDIVMRSDGNIYFTDPWWDFGAGETTEIGETTSWHLRRDGVLQAFGGNWAVCNGLALSVDETVLFVNDTIHMHIRAFDVAADGTVDSASDRIFCELPGSEDGKPDGMKLDIAGNVYCGGPGGLWVFSPQGRHLGTIRHGGCQTNNLCFGGSDWQSLYMCSWTTLHSLPVLIPGVRTPDARR